MREASKIAVAAAFVIVIVAGVWVVTGEDANEGEAAPGCGAGETAKDRDPQEAGVKRGDPVLLGCLRLRGGTQAHLSGYPLNGRPCIDVIDPGTGEGGGCNDQLGEKSIEAGSRSRRAGRGERISGRTDPRTRRVRVRYLSAAGCVVHVRAGHVTVRDRTALRRSANGGPFGFYVVDLPRGARPLTLEAVAGQGRVLGEARLGPESAGGAPPRTAPPTCRAPYVGVSCRQPNSIACDRVAVSVPANRFVRHARATIAGRRVLLRSSRSVGRDGLGTFVGVLRSAGLREGRLRVKTEPGTDRWLGDPPVAVPFRVDVQYAGGRRASQTFRLSLHPGYG